MIYSVMDFQSARLGLAAEHPDRTGLPRRPLYGCTDTEVRVAAKQPNGRRQKKPPLTATRYKQMVRELAHLYDKYQGDMDEIISFMGLQIASAVDRARRMTKSPKAGAPELWNKDQLARLWVKVRALQIASPGLTVRQICRELVSAKSRANPDDLDFDVEVWPEVTGYEVWADEKRSISREEVSRYVTNAEQLRRRFGDADKAIRATDGARERLEERAQDLVRLWRTGPPSRRRGR